LRRAPSTVVAPAGAEAGAAATVAGGAGWTERSGGAEGGCVTGGEGWAGDGGSDLPKKAKGYLQKKKRNDSIARESAPGPLEGVERATGFEPATPGMTTGGQRNDNPVEIAVKVEPHTPPG